MKLTSTKLDGLLFLRFLFDSPTLVLAQCFSKQDILFNFLIISFFQVLAPHQQVHVLFLLQDTLITTKIAYTCKRFVQNGLFSFCFLENLLLGGVLQV
jgi:hypothetical protein